MRIASSEVSLRASHVAEVSSEATASLRAWVGDAGNTGEPAVRVRLSDDARGAAPPPPPATTEASAASASSDTHDSRLALLQYFVERLTGQRMRIVTADELRDECGAANVEPPPSAANASTEGPQRAGFGIELDATSVYREFEQMQFAAEGTIRTEDGRTFQFQLQLLQTRSYEETVSLQLRAGDAVRKDPLVLNFSGGSARLLDTRFDFDLDADGSKERVAMLGSGSGYLALDISGNGRIDSGAELFGARSGDGFADLAKYDDDGNQVIDENDAVFARLRIWTPDANGAGELQTLADRGVGALLLSRIATPFELRSGATELGAVKTTGLYLTEDGRAGTMQQIDLVV